ncbi:MAG: hypothetical protein M3357_20145 [Actinomycetota bacterium]|nr:hypothetical protein [Actinomycetota bacterium]
MPRTKVMLWSAVGAVAALAVLLVPAAQGGVHEVVIKEKAFEPREAYLGEGDTILWIHDGGKAIHTVTADDGSFDSSPTCTDGTQDDCLEAGETFEWQTTKVGRYPYHSKTDPSVKGVVIVVEKGTGPSSTVPQ